MFDKQQNSIEPAGDIESDAGNIWNRGNNEAKGAEIAPPTKPVVDDGPAEQPTPPASTDAGAPSDRIDRVTRSAAPAVAPILSAPANPEQGPVSEPMATAEMAGPDGDSAPATVESYPDSDGAEATATGQILTVGRGIRLVAKACECDGLAVDGHLEATAQAKSLVVSKGGSFIGKAEVATAEITGTFEGNLTVTERLTIHPGGSVSGTTHYQEIVIEAGGQISGSTQCLGASPNRG